jgi:hypothetical protein
MKRQPRAKIGQGGYSPSLGERDPRNRRSQQPQVAANKVRERALQRLGELDGTATTDQLRETINEVVRILKEDG